MEEKTVITFDPDGTLPTCVHGWDESRAAMERREPIVTSQVGLLSDKLVKSYDVVRIVAAGSFATIEKDGKAWKTDSTSKVVKGVQNWFNMWRGGEFPGTKSFSKPEPPEDDDSFAGTPIECEAWLRKKFEMMRLALTGYTSVMVDGKLEPGGSQEDVLEKYERSIWKVTVKGTDMVAANRMRSSMVVDASLIDTEREVVQLLMKNG